MKTRKPKMPKTRGRGGKGGTTPGVNTPKMKSVKSPSKVKDIDMLKKWNV